MRSAAASMSSAGSGNASVGVGVGVGLLFLLARAGDEQQRGRNEDGERSEARAAAHRATTSGGPASTRPIRQQPPVRSSISRRSASAPSSGSAISRPPEVCGS